MALWVGRLIFAQVLITGFVGGTCYVVLQRRGEYIPALAGSQLALGPLRRLIRRHFHFSPIFASPWRMLRD